MDVRTLAAGVAVGTIDTPKLARMIAIAGTGKWTHLLMAKWSFLANLRLTSMWPTWTQLHSGRDSTEDREPFVVVEFSPGQQR